MCLYLQIVGWSGSQPGAVELNPLSFPSRSALGTISDRMAQCMCLVPILVIIPISSIILGTSRETETTPHRSMSRLDALEFGWYLLRSGARVLNSLLRRRWRDAGLAGGNPRSTRSQRRTCRYPPELWDVHVLPIR